VTADEGYFGERAALEFAIGTGRIALPLAERGVRVAGIDNSDAMLDRLREKPGADRITTVAVRVPNEVPDSAAVTPPEPHFAVRI